MIVWFPPKKPVMSWPPLRYMEEKDAFWSNTSFASTSKASKLQALQLFLVKPNRQHVQPAHHTDSVPPLPKASRVITSESNHPYHAKLDEFNGHWVIIILPVPTWPTQTMHHKGEIPPKVTIAIVWATLDPPKKSVALRVFRVDIRGSAFWGSATIFFQSSHHRWVQWFQRTQPSRHTHDTTNCRNSCSTFCLGKWFEQKKRCQRLTCAFHILPNLESLSAAIWTPFEGSKEFRDLRRWLGFWWLTPHLSPVLHQAQDFGFLAQRVSKNPVKGCSFHQNVPIFCQSFTKGMLFTTNIKEYITKIDSGRSCLFFLHLWNYLEIFKVGSFFFLGRP